MLQIVFNEISAAEISRLDTLEQLDLLSEFCVTKESLQNIDGKQFGRLEREGKTLYRFKAKEFRIYFEALEEMVVVHRILNKNTFSDFLYRSTNIALNEDEELGKSKHFWQLIDEGRNAKRV